MEDEKCCIAACESPIDQDYWNQQYAANATGWDLGATAPALKDYIDALPSKELRILIPGCGNAHEAAYLIEQGFSNVTVIDIAPLLVERLDKKFAGVEGITTIHGDFFTHRQEYDLIIEQTFFCALPPYLRQRYVFQMHRLLKPDGILAGLLFDRKFETGPPFGGSKTEYESLFSKAFGFRQFSTCANSVEKRAGTEVFIELHKEHQTTMQLYSLKGITCGNCSTTITEKFLAVDGVLNCSISSDFKELLLASAKNLPLEALEEVLSHDKDYHIELIEN